MIKPPLLSVVKAASVLIPKFVRAAWIAGSSPAMTVMHWQHERNRHART
jgi:hypothetical protein